MIKNLKVLEKYIVVTLLFLLPTQFALHFWPSWAFIFGLRVDLLAPALYLTDVFVLLLLSVSIIRNHTFFEQFTKHKTLLATVLIFAILNSIFSTSIPISIYRWIKIIEFIFLTLYFFKQETLKLSTIVKTLFYSALLFSIIGILQFFKGGTVGGLLYYLGERTFNMGTPGIALVSFNGAEHLRAYSTFSHPNSLAGFLGGTILFILLSGQIKKSFINFIGILITLICFLLTFSISAYIGIFFAFAYYLFSKNKKMFNCLVLITLFVFVLGSLLLPLFSSWLIKTLPFIGQNIGERLDLAYISGKMISKKFLIGEGLGSFIVNIPAYKGIFSYSWLLQPVHNIFLLILSETGIVGLLAFCFLIYKSVVYQLRNKNIYLLIPLLFVLFTGLFDHYTITLQQNTLLFSIFIGMAFNVRMANAK